MANRELDSKQYVVESDRKGQAIRRKAMMPILGNDGEGDLSHC